MSEYCENCRVLQKTITELEADALGQNAIRMHQNGLIAELNSVISQASVSRWKVERLQATIDELEAYKKRRITQDHRRHGLKEKTDEHE